MTLLRCFSKASGSSYSTPPSSPGSLEKRIGIGPASPPAPLKVGPPMGQARGTAAATLSSQRRGVAFTSLAGSGMTCSCSWRSPSAVAPTAQR
jgi:hypothetical protein